MVKKNTHSFSLIPYPKDRKLTADLYAISLQQHNISGITEFDITESYNQIQDLKQSGSNISFLAFIVNCLAKAIDENKIVQGMKQGRNKIKIFDDVDICTIIGSEDDYQKIPIAHIIRKTNHKDLAVINREIQDVKHSLDEKYKEMEKTIDNLLRIPRFLRRKFIERKYKRDPNFRKKNAGTACITSLGALFQGRSGWGLPLSSNPIYVILGGIEEKPRVKNKEIIIRTMLNVTIVFDHDIVDGAPAIKFTKDFGAAVEQGYGLENYQK